VLQAVTSEKTQLQIFNRKHLYKKYISSQWCSTRSEMQRYFKLDWITNSRLRKDSMDSISTQDFHLKGAIP
jgi:hypothetical protein